MTDKFSRLLTAAKALRDAQRTLAAHPENDTTKVWERKLWAVETAEAELDAVIAESE